MAGNWDDESIDNYESDKIREVSSSMETEEKIVQVYKIDQNCKLFRLGFTVEEVQEALENE